MGSLRLEPGQVFAGDYKVVGLLAEGGMGAVYRVEQLSTGVERALKVMQPELLGARDPAVAARNRERFLQEARVGARIASEHVVSVLAAGVDAADGAPWLVMELLSGQDLRHMIERSGALPAVQVRKIFDGLCHALGAAHRAGVMHLDLKPENVFVAESRLEGVDFVVKVLDFGISRIVLDHKMSATVTTAIGSPLWLAPEQAMRGARVTSATDVWALGLIAYRLLTGRHYWREGDVPEEEFRVTSWLLELVTSELSPASERAAEQGVVAALPPGFDAWFSRCVVRDLAARFRDAGEAGAALRAVFDGAAPATPAPTPALPAAPIAHAPAVVQGTLALTAGALPSPHVATSPLGATPTSPSGPTGTMVVSPQAPATNAPPRALPRSAAAVAVPATLAALGVLALGIMVARRNDAPRDALPAAPAVAEVPRASPALDASSANADPPPASEPPVVSPPVPAPAAPPPAVAAVADAEVVRPRGYQPRVSLPSGGACRYRRYVTQHGDAEACCRRGELHGVPVVWTYQPVVNEVGEYERCTARAEARSCRRCPRRADILCCP